MTPVLLVVSSNGSAPGDDFFLWLSFLTGFVAAIAHTKLETFYHIFRRKEEKQGRRQGSRMRNRNVVLR